MSGELGVVNVKLDGIMSLLLDMASGQDEPLQGGEPSPSNHILQPQSNSNLVVGGGAGVVNFGAGGGGGGSGSSETPPSFIEPAAPAATVRGAGGGDSGSGQWGVGAGVGGGRHPPRRSRSALVWDTDWQLHDSTFSSGPQPPPVAVAAATPEGSPPLLGAIPADRSRIAVPSSARTGERT